MRRLHLSPPTTTETELHTMVASALDKLLLPPASTASNGCAASDRGGMGPRYLRKFFND
jgi:hypothetical protein